MRWVLVFFLVLLSVPVAQVTADAWYGRPGPEFLIARASADAEAGPRAVRSTFAPVRHSRLRLYDPLAPLFPPRAKTS